MLAYRTNHHTSSGALNRTEEAFTANLDDDRLFFSGRESDMTGVACYKDVIVRGEPEELLKLPASAVVFTSEEHFNSVTNPRAYLEQALGQDHLSAIFSLGNSHQAWWRGLRDRSVTLSDAQQQLSPPRPEKTARAPKPAGQKLTVRGLPRETKLKVLRPNPKKAGSASHARFELYHKSATVGKFLELGGRMEDVKFDLAHGFIELAAPA